MDDLYGKRTQIIYGMKINTKTCCFILVTISLARICVHIFVILPGSEWFVGADETKSEGWLKSVEAGEVNIPTNWLYWVGEWQEDKQITISGQILHSYTILYLKTFFCASYLECLTTLAL